MSTAASWQNRFNRTLAGVQNQLGTAEAIGNIFGVSVADAIGVNSPSSGIRTPQDGFNIQNFIAKVGESDLMRTTLFLTNFNHCNDMLRLNYGSGDLETVRLMTEAFSLPGVSFATSDNIRRYGYGQIEARPHTPIFSDIAFSFLVDGKGQIFKYFHNWMHSTIPFGSMDDGNKNERYLVSYKTDYATDIELLVYNPAAQQIMVCRLRDAHPVAVDPIQMSWGSNDEVARLIVTFKFTDYTTEVLEVGSDRASNLSFFQRLQQGASVVQTLSTLTRPQSINDVVRAVDNISVIRSGIDLF